MERFRNYKLLRSSWRSVSYSCLFLHCQVNVDIQISNPNFLEKGFSKDQDGKCILNKSRYSKFYKKILTASQTTVGPFSSTPIHSRYIYWQAKKTLGMTMTAVRQKKKIQIEKLSPGVCIRKNTNVLWQSHQITCRFKNLKLCISPSQNTCNNFRITLLHVLML